MEVNAAPQLDLDGLPDDDLITYDSDAEKVPDYVEDVERTDFAQAAASGEVGDEEYDHEAEAEDEAVPQEEAVLFENDEQNGSESRQQGIEGIDEGPDEGQEPSHEIDYQFEEPTHQDTEGVTKRNEGSAAGEQDQAEDSLDDEKAKKQREARKPTDDHEISWEPDDEQVDRGSPDLATATGELSFPNALPNYETEKQDDFEEHGDVAAAHPEESEPEHLEIQACDEMDQEEGEDRSEQDEHSQQEYSDTDDHEFPAITVHYKGDEFPFFSVSSEGFFSQLSVLDDSLKSLLSGLREELASELSAGDDLVFQVDELGLEFAEVS
jgi:hypothetical protein